MLYNISFQHLLASLDLLQLFMWNLRLGMDDLGLDDACKAVLIHYEKDIMEVQKTYMELKDHPPMDRDMPPMAGKIWL